MPRGSWASFEGSGGARNRQGTSDGASYHGCGSGSLSPGESPPLVVTVFDLACVTVPFLLAGCLYRRALAAVVVFLWIAVPAAAAERAVPFDRAVTLGDFGPAAYEPTQTPRTLRRLARTYRVRGVTLLAIWMQKDAGSTELRPGSETVRTENLKRAIRSARAAGMRVTLRPYVDRDDGGWRGEIQPSSVDAWFASYRRFILRYAKFAQRYKVRQLVIGSEMESMAQYSSRWRSLIRAVRRQFKGLVAYQANWDGYDRVAWWRSVDVASISAYFPLTDKDGYSTADLVAGWRGSFYGGRTRNWFEEISEFQRGIKRPVMFGEIGYRSIAGSAKAPYDIALAGSYSPTAQAQAYEAAFRVWYRVPWFKGFHWWYVPTFPRTGGSGSGLSGADHSPEAAARGVIRRWYGRRR